jgi:signal transduction histidine kinase
MNADGRPSATANIYRDITEQKRAHAAVSNVNRKLIEAQEQERSRIARELHDDVAQRLAALAFEVHGLTTSEHATPLLHHKMVMLRDHISQIAMDVSSLSRELHSPRLELLGITAAGKDFCETAARQHDAMVDFEALGVPDHLPPDISLCLFRVLQEAVHNAIRHSGVRQVQVQLWGAPGHVHLVVRDGGAGFDVEIARSGRGIGLISMAERIKLVDGELSIESNPQRGTKIRVRVRIPLDE